ncbi:hypothetical protein ABZ686_14955, partial [Streptomyces sp. NPDC006992]|uniref:hypothetical protein n=1 Tax=Streptomyces sp. NPDC006992 TaxID=3155601 RepID=UPI003403CAAD
LAAAVLFIVSVGKVQGFAFTLGLTTALDVVVAPASNAGASKGSGVPSSSSTLPDRDAGS